MRASPEGRGGECPELLVLERLAQGSDDRDASVEEHVSSCALCRSQITDLRANEGLIEDLERLFAESRAGEEPEELPASIGSYEIVRRIGAGGMGIVYEAVQGEPRRNVALKVVRGADAVGTRRLRLFEREIETLARLEHPGIATIYDAGSTEDGQPFFAMELVAGTTLVRHARAANLDTRSRLALFGEVCDALHHAHLRGVIHRDLKPSNILVDASGHARVLDFGLARITDSDVALASLDTNPGRLQGTLPYMSPEQVRGDPHAIDLRSDVYSLGVVLFQLLTEELPFDLRELAPHEAAWVICEGAPTRAPALRGELAAIVYKALDQQPSRRYQSAAALGDDVRRFLAGEPVLARPASTAYQLRKLVARHRLASALALLLVLLSIGSAVWLRWSYGRAAEEAQSAQRNLGFLKGMLTSINPDSAGRNVGLAEMLDRAAADAGGQFAAEPELEADVRSTIAGVYGGLTLHERATTELRRALELRRELLGDEHALVLADKNALAHWLIRRGELDEAAALLEETIASGERSGAALQVASAQGALARVRRGQGRYEDAEVLYRTTLERLAADPAASASLVATTRTNLAELLAARGAFEEADPLYREAIASLRAAGPLERSSLSLALNNLGLSLLSQRRLDEAQPVLAEALEIRTEISGADDERAAPILNNLANIEAMRGEFAAAEARYRSGLAILRRVHGDAHPDMAIQLGNLAYMVSMQGDDEEAERLLREKLAMQHELLGEQHPEIANTLANLGSVLYSAGRYRDAEPLFVEAAAMARELLGEDHPDVTWMLSNLGSVYGTLGNHARAVPIAREVVERERAQWGPDHANVGEATYTLAMQLWKQGESAEALPLFEEGLRVVEASYGEEHYRVADVLTGLAGCHTDTGRVEEAAEALERAQTIAVAALGEEHARTMSVRQGLARVAFVRGELAAAEEQLREILVWRRANQAGGHPSTAETLVLLAQVLLERGDVAGAEPALREAREIQASALVEGHWYLAKSASLLGRCRVLRGELAEAEALLLETLSEIESDRGADHRETIAALERVCELYERWGKAGEEARFHARLDAARAR